MYSILKKEKIAKDTNLFVISAPELAHKARPGQFVIVRLREEGERIPLTIADLDKSKGTITLIVLEIGYSTRQMGKLQAGEALLDLAGPLGKPTHISKVGTVIGIGGGIGIAPVYPVLQAFKEAGNKTIAIIGAKTKDYLFWEEKMSNISDQLYVTTDDGSSGQQGFVIDPLKKLIANGTAINLIFAVGPTPMMKAVADTTRPGNIPTVVSLNPIMIDGTGMCGGCRITVGGETKFTCVDGPEFDAHKVDFNLLMQRQSMYKEKEANL